MKNKFKKISWLWKSFWGRRYWIYKNDEMVQTILIYKRRIYLIDK